MADKAGLKSQFFEFSQVLHQTGSSIKSLKHLTGYNYDAFKGLPFVELSVKSSYHCTYFGAYHNKWSFLLATECD